MGSFCNPEARGSMTFPRFFAANAVFRRKTVASIGFVLLPALSPALARAPQCAIGFVPHISHHLGHSRG